MKNEELQVAMDGKDGRSRNFATIVYPESAPEGWIDFLRELHVQTFISPLHDKDKHEDGTPKKPHYHVMLMFEGKKSYNKQIKPIFDSIGAVGREFIFSFVGYARYLCHLDEIDEGKPQYDVNDVISLAGVDYLEVVKMPRDTDKALKQMEEWCLENGCIYYMDLATYARINRADWHKVLIKHSLHMIYFMRSLEYKCKAQIEPPLKNF